ncbi:MAG: PTS sugar transporter subunit IIA [Candidatus Aureabacteria bacterium]|nr:PTS sugar transporter subunit IIA [Candidatus Auribacterota bacterium]
MINLKKYIFPELILPGLDTGTKEDIIKAITEKIFDVKPDCAGTVSRETAYTELIARERLQTTGLGEGMAFPHARIKGWGQFVIALGITKKAVDFASLDKKPVQFICVMISSQDDHYIILQVMSAIMRFMRDTGNIKTLFGKDDSGKIAESLRNYNLETQKSICARDITRPIKSSVTLETSIEEATRIMHLNHLDVLPVVDENNNLRGQISCFDIFTYGVPDFFKQLHTVSFVKNLDPFEKYFKIKKDLKVEALTNKNCITVAEDATLLEIVFLLAVKNNQKLFVVNHGKLEGEIDRFSIIDKVLFF